LPPCPLDLCGTGGQIVRCGQFSGDPSIGGYAARMGCDVGCARCVIRGPRHMRQGLMLHGWSATWSMACRAAGPSCARPMTARRRQRRRGGLPGAASASLRQAAGGDLSARRADPRRALWHGSVFRVRHCGRPPGRGDRPVRRDAGHSPGPGLAEAVQQVGPQDWPTRALSWSTRHSTNRTAGATVTCCFARSSLHCVTPGRVPPRRGR
jgi:hypothetical protein